VLTVAERSARRRELVAPFLDPNNVLVGTFVMERADVAARMAVGGFLGGWLFGLVGAAAALLVGVAGKTAEAPSEPTPVTVAVLEDGIVLLRNDWRGRPKALAERLPGRGALGPVEGSMQGRVTFRGVAYDVPVGCVDEARRLQGSA
jgi:hypothetical protein